MKRCKKLFVALLLLLMTFTLSSCRLPLAISMLAFDARLEQERQKSKMEAEIVGEVSFIVEEKASDCFVVDATFYIKNNGEADCDDWELAAYFYDAEGYLIYSRVVTNDSWEYDGIDCPQVLKKGETTEIRLLYCEMPYRPASVQIKDVGLYNFDMWDFKD